MLDVFYPGRCALCDEVLPAGKHLLCRHCNAMEHLVGCDYCLKCGRPVPEGVDICKQCEGRKTTYISGRSVFKYDGVLRNSVKGFKYYGRKEYADFYAQYVKNELEQWIKTIAPDALLPVPVHKNKLKKRGYNQAEIIAEKIGEILSIPVINDMLIRIRNTAPQKELSGEERIRNLNQAFAINDNVRLYENVKCVIIIDDIFTTGSTIESCARKLSEAGIKKIYYICICTGYGS